MKLISEKTFSGQFVIAGSNQRDTIIQPNQLIPKAKYEKENPSLA